MKIPHQPLHGDTETHSSTCTGWLSKPLDTCDEDSTPTTTVHSDSETRVQAIDLCLWPVYVILCVCVSVSPCTVVVGVESSSQVSNGLLSHPVHVLLCVSVSPCSGIYIASVQWLSASVALLAPATQSALQHAIHLLSTPSLQCLHCYWSVCLSLCHSVRLSLCLFFRLLHY